MSHTTILEVQIGDKGLPVLLPAFGPDGARLDVSLASGISLTFVGPDGVALMVAGEIFPLGDGTGLGYVPQDGDGVFELAGPWLIEAAFSLPDGYSGATEIETAMVLHNIQAYAP